MKKNSLLTLLALLLLAGTAHAQSSVDSTILGSDIFSLISQKGSGSVTINQSYDLRNALSRHIVSNSNTRMQGYRVRIFFDSDRTARAK